MLFLLGRGAIVCAASGVYPHHHTSFGHKYFNRLRMNAPLSSFIHKYNDMIHRLIYLCASPFYQAAVRLCARLPGCTHIITSPPNKRKEVWATLKTLISQETADKRAREAKDRVGQAQAQCLALGTSTP
jgi:hypothetical protein